LQKEHDLLFLTTKNPENVFLITESWLNETIPSGFFSRFSNDFVVYRCDRSQEEGRERHGGGVIVLIPKKYTNFEVKVEKSKFFESLWSTISRDHTATKKLIFGVYYRSPFFPQNDSINAVINHIRTNYDPFSSFVLCGDFNLPGLKWDGISVGNKNEEMFSEAMFEIGLTQHVHVPTHVAGNILDLVFVNNLFLMQQCEVEQFHDISDHFAILFKIAFQSIKRSVSRNDIPDFKNANYTEISRELCLFDWTAAFSFCVNVDQMWEILYNYLIFLVLKWVPFCPVRPKNCNWSSETSSAYERQWSTHLRYKKSGKDKHKLEWKAASRHARFLKRKDIFMQENGVLKSEQINKFWSYIKSRLSNRSVIPPMVGADGNIVVDYGEKAKIFNSFFVSVFTEDDGKLVNMINPDHIRSPPLPVCDRLNVFEHIKALSAKFSSGPDSIPQNFLVKLALELSEPLSRIYSLSIHSGIFPSNWKIAKVVPLHKKGIISVVENYRPISLLNAASKPLESIIRQHILTHLKQNSIIGECQHGFLPKHSTITQLISCLDDWTKIVDQNNTVDVIYLDIAKAFDSVSHTKLIQKMTVYGFNVKIISWVRNYLLNRSQFVQVEDAVSENCPVSSGVVQGSLIGPVLFLIYINDIVNYVKTASLKLYADDAKIYISCPRNEQNVKLKEDLKQIMSWADNVQLRIAVNKCFVLQIGYGNAKTQYEVQDFPVPSVKCMRDLGVIVSDDLKFSAHCKMIAQKAFIRAALIFKVFRCRDRNFLVKMFITFVRSLLEYATEVWNPCIIKDIDLIERVQRSFTRRIPGMAGLSYPDRLKALKLESLEHRRVVRDLVFVYKILFGLVSLSFSDYFEMASRSGQRKNHEYCLKWIRVNKEIRKNFFAVRTIPIWNALPSQVFEVCSVSTFRQRISVLDFSQFFRGTATAGNRPCRSLALIP